MSRRRLSKAETIGAGVGIVLLISFISNVVQAAIQFIRENYVKIIIVFAVPIFVLLTCIIIINLKNKKIIRLYKNTPYYKTTMLPYEEVMKNKGLHFEMFVFSELATKYPNAFLITNLLIPRIGSVNEYSEIDMVFLHETGLYVLELKNYSGYVYGNVANEYWNVGYKTDNNRTVHQFLNPILQNETHIRDLQNHTNREYFNYVIFSTDTEIDSNIDNVGYLSDFLSVVSQTPPQFLENDLRIIFDVIVAKNVYEKMDKHIERIKYNEKRYSKFE